MLKVPCKDCPDRNPGCHSTCAAYISYRAELDKINAEKNENKKFEDFFNYHARYKRYKKGKVK